MTNTTRVHIPEISKTSVITEDGEHVVRDVPTQVPGENEVLIKVAVVGLNPTDWRNAQPVNAGNYAGCDFAGEVVKVGPNPRVNFKIGDKVSATTLGNSSTERGAFSEYAKTFSQFVWKIPDGTFSFEEAVTTGVPLCTALQVLYGPPKTLCLTRPGAAVPPEADTWIYIHGGSSSVGQYAIQLAKLSGYKVATVASPHNHKLLENLGADLIFDYRDSQLVEKVKKGTGDKIHIAFDTISEPDTQVISVRVLAENKPGKVNLMLLESEEAQKIREDVQVITIWLPTAFGVETRRWKPIKEDAEAFAPLVQIIPDLVKAGKLKPNTVKLWDGGLEKIGEGLAYLKDGKASAEKVVFRV